MAKKLNSMRLLDQQNIPYETIEYGSAADFHDAETVAEIVGVPVDMVYKTLVVAVADSTKPALALIAADRVLDLKAVAAALGVKKAAMAAHNDAEKWTGLQVGGISPLALQHKNWIVVLDQAAMELEHMLVSAGQRGMQIRIPTQALIRLTGARLAEISREKP